MSGMIRGALALLFAGMLSIAALAQGDGPPTQLAQANAQLAEANRLYGEKDFATALEIYQRLYEAGWRSPELLTNAGNAAYRAGDVGRAVLAYKRALEISPSDSTARLNLGLVQPQTNRVDEGEASQAAVEWFRATSPWLWLALLELAFLFFLVSAYSVGRSAPATEVRGVWWSRLAGASFLLLLTVGIFALHRATLHSGGDAVVMKDRAITRTGPGESFLEQLELPAGTIVTLADPPQGGWVRVRLLDGRAGYLSTDVLESI